MSSVAEPEILPKDSWMCPAQFNAAKYCVGSKRHLANDKVAMIAADGDANKTGEWSFAEIEDKVLRVAGGLNELGIKRGDRVLLCVGDVPEFPIAYFGVIAMGAIAVPLSAALSKGELDWIEDECTPALTIVASDNARPVGTKTVEIDTLVTADVGEFADTSKNDPAFLVFTSGSTGRPKGVLHAHRSFWARRSMHAGWHDISLSDTVLHAGAFNWTFTLGVGLADTWSVGATALVLHGDRSPTQLPQVAARFAPTIFAAAPAVFRKLVKYEASLQDAFSSLRHAVTAGETLHPNIQKQWLTMTGKPLLEALGMSEVSTFISTPPSCTVPLGHVGWPQKNRRIALLNDAGEPADKGELAVHAQDEGLMLGYWQKSGAISAFENEWFKSGDLLVRHPSGALKYLGRKDSQLNAQGDPAPVSPDT